MVSNEFSRQLRRLISDRSLTQKALIDKLKSQRFSRSASAVSRWVRGTRTPPAEVVEVLEDIFEVKKGWLLKCAGYPADAQIRSSWLISPEQDKHLKELSIALLPLVSNLESYQEHIDDDVTSRGGNGSTGLSTTRY